MFLDNDGFRCVVGNSDLSCYALYNAWGGPGATNLDITSWF